MDSGLDHLYFLFKRSLRLVKLFLMGFFEEVNGLFEFDNLLGKALLDLFRVGLKLFDANLKQGNLILDVIWVLGLGGAD